jgi:hypothetical protein
VNALTLPLLFIVATILLVAVQVTVRVTEALGGSLG